MLKSKSREQIGERKGWAGEVEINCNNEVIKLINQMIKLGSQALI